jgi:hypothetical protein
MATKARVTLAVQKSFATAQETENAATVNFERIVVEMLSMRAIGVDAGEHVVKYLRDAGNSAAMAVDGSVTPVPFIYAVTPGQNVVIESIAISALDAGVAPHLFGGIAALTNGITLLIDSGGASPTTVLDILDAVPIKRNSDLAALGSAEFAIVDGSADDLVCARLRLARPMRMVSPQRLVATVRDNLTALTSLTMVAIGITRSTDAV